MYLVYDISDNKGNIHNSKLLSSTDNIEDIIEICNNQSKIVSNTFFVVPLFPFPSSNFESLGYCLYADGMYNKYMAIDTEFPHKNPVLIPFVRNYKINEII